MFGKTKGSTLIDSAIGKFTAIVESIEIGIAQNAETIGANAQAVNRLVEENHRLLDDNARGESVARKLRELLA